MPTIYQLSCPSTPMKYSLNEFDAFSRRNGVSKHRFVLDSLKTCGKRNQVPLNLHMPHLYKVAKCHTQQLKICWENLKKKTNNNNNFRLCEFLKGQIMRKQYEGREQEDERDRDRERKKTMPNRARFPKSTVGISWKRLINSNPIQARESWAVYNLSEMRKDAQNR